MSHNAVRFNARPAHRLVTGSGQLAFIRFNYDRDTGAVQTTPIAFPFTNCRASVVTERGTRMAIYGKPNISVHYIASAQKPQ